MITLDQHNQIHSIIRDAETQIQQLTGLSIHLSIYKNAKATFTERDAMAVVLDVLHIKHADFTSKSRSNNLVDARILVCLVLRTFFQISHSDMAELIHRDRTSVIHLLTNGTNYINTGNPPFINKYERVLEAVQLKFGITHE
jgi:chromosomal replication initiation ATPase DnaA